MKQFAIIGLSRFGKRMLEELLNTEAEILLIDKDRELIEEYRDKVAKAYIADAINEAIIRKLIPQSIDAAIVDLGDRVEVSILVTNYLKKIGVKEIIAKAETNEHGEILELVGATNVIFPAREAAKRIVPMLVSSQIFKYLPISKHFAIAEVKTPENIIGTSLIELNLRKKYNINVIAFRILDEADYAFFSPEYRLKGEDILLVGGSEENIAAFAGIEFRKTPQKGLTGAFKRFFGFRA